MEDVFDAPAATPMTAAEFAAVGERTRLAVNPALVLLELRYPANAYMNALRRGERPRIPRPRASRVIVFRRGFQVLRREQEPEQFRLLRALVAGKPLAAAVRASMGRSTAQRGPRCPTPARLVRGVGRRAPVRQSSKIASLTAHIN